MNILQQLVVHIPSGQDRLEFVQYFVSSIQALTGRQVSFMKPIPKAIIIKIKNL